MDAAGRFQRLLAAILEWRPAFDAAVVSGDDDVVTEICRVVSKAVGNEITVELLPEGSDEFITSIHDTPGVTIGKLDSLISAVGGTPNTRSKRHRVKQLCSIVANEE